MNCVHKYFLETVLFTRGFLLRGAGEFFFLALKEDMVNAFQRTESVHCFFPPIIYRGINEAVIY